MRGNSAARAVAAMKFSRSIGRSTAANTRTLKGKHIFDNVDGISSFPRRTLYLSLI